MTAYYRMPGFSLAHSNLSTKLLITFFLACALGALSVALLQYADRAGLSRQEAEEWLLGNEGDSGALEIKMKRSYRELLAITHEHAFTVPLVVFVLMHFVGLCSLPERWKIALYSTAFLSVAASFAGIWLVAYAGGAWTLLVRGAGIVMALSIALGCAIPLREMWWVGRRRPARAAPPERP